MGGNDRLNGTLATGMVGLCPKSGGLRCQDGGCPGFNGVMLAGQHAIDCPDPAGGRSGRENGSKMGLVGAGERSVNGPGRWLTKRQPHEVGQLLLSGNEFSVGGSEVGPGGGDGDVENGLIMWVTAWRHHLQLIDCFAGKADAGIPG